MTLPPDSGYLTINEFSNMATYLDIKDLVGGGSAAVNTGELAKELARASVWCDNALAGPTIGAKTWTDKLRGRIDRYGMLTVRPHHTSGNIPVRSIAAVSYGSSPTALTSLTVSNDWSTDGLISIPIGGGTLSWSGALQFNGIGRVGPSTELFVQPTYVSGWPSTVLTADTAVSDTVLHVKDPTGIMVGDVLTVVDPGSATVSTVNDETVTVLSVAGSTITLTAPLSLAHTAANGIGVSQVPADLKKAVGFVARSFLGRRGAEKSKPTWAGQKVATKGTDQQVLETDDYLAQAVVILDTYMRKSQ